MAIEYFYEMAGVIDEAHGVKKGRTNSARRLFACRRLSTGLTLEGTWRLDSCR
jgi:hypothetical protein